MAGIVSIASKAEVKAEVKAPLSCLNEKFAFFKKQIQIWEKLQKIDIDGGFEEVDLPEKKVSYSIESTIDEIYEEARRLKEGDLTDSEIFELLEKLVDTRADAKFKVQLDSERIVTIDRAIVALLNCVNE